jgi:hypothetical protein
MWCDELIMLIRKSTMWKPKASSKNTTIRDYLPLIVKEEIDDCYADVGYIPPVEFNALGAGC